MLETVIDFLNHSLGLPVLWYSDRLSGAEHVPISAQSEQAEVHQEKKEKDFKLAIQQAAFQTVCVGWKIRSHPTDEN